MAVTPRLANKWLGELTNMARIIQFLRKREVIGLNDPHQDKDVNVFDYLKLLAKELVNDEYLEKLYPNLLAESFLSELEKTIGSFESGRSGNIVGLDWIDNELGNPFCIFSHLKFINFIRLCKATNPDFGLHLSIGVNLIRSVTMDTTEYSKTQLAFYLHLLIVMEGIKLTHKKLETVGPRMRLTLGHSFIQEALTSNDRKSPFAPHMEDFLSFLSGSNIVCEIDPSILEGREFGSQVVDFFLKWNVSIILKTDTCLNEKCSPHNRHEGPAALFCSAIYSDGISSKDELERLLENSKRAKFSRDEHMKGDSENPAVDSALDSVVEKSGY